MTKFEAPGSKEFIQEFEFLENLEDLYGLHYLIFLFKFSPS